jgi:hypothetical protein
MSSERLGEHEASGIAISANKSKPEGKPSVSQADVCRHNFPSDSAQLPSSDPRGETYRAVDLFSDGSRSNSIPRFATAVEKLLIQANDA